MKKNPLLSVAAAIAMISSVGASDDPAMSLGRQAFGFARPKRRKANACALTHIEEAQHWLQQRTLERMRRGVEGTHGL